MATLAQKQAIAIIQQMAEFKTPNGKQQQLVMWLLNITVTLLTTIMMFFTASIWTDLNEMKKEVYTNSANITAVLKDIERLENKIDLINQKLFSRTVSYVTQK